MPRGGRRPGAGAPRGNMNAFRNGNHSRRALMVYTAILTCPDRRPIALALRDAGFFRQRAPDTAYAFNGDVAGVVAFLYPRLFDRSHPGSIKFNQAQSTEQIQNDTTQPRRQIRPLPKTKPENTIKPRRLKC